MVSSGGIRGLNLNQPVAIQSGHCGCGSAKCYCKNPNQRRHLKASPLVSSVLLPGLVELELCVGGLEGAAGVHGDEVTVLGDLLCGVDGAGDLE
jgi:hypothetical protein